jgi:hypothetical protein
MSTEAMIVLQQHQSPGRLVVLPVWQVVCLEDKGPNVCAVHWACGATKGVSTVQGSAQAIAAQVEAGMRSCVALLLGEIALRDAASEVWDQIGHRAASKLKREMGGLVADPAKYIRDQISLELRALAGEEAEGDKRAAKTQKAGGKKAPAKAAAEA